MIALAGTPVLTTGRLVLRAPVAGDWPHWRAFALSDRSRFLTDYDEPLAWRAFCHLIGMWVTRGFGSFVFHEKGSREPLGMAGPWYPVDWPEAEIGWSVWSPGAEGKGYAFEAAEATVAHAFGTLGWQTAVSYIDPQNARSIALAQRLGARQDVDAAVPDPSDPCLVFRHPDPQPEARP